MKEKTDIEKLLEQQKSHYKVPEGYFDEIIAKYTQDNATGKPRKTKVFRIGHRWMVAAGLLLFFSIAFHKWFKPYGHTPAHPGKPAEHHDALLEGISDDEIIDYLMDYTDAVDMME